MPSSAASYAQRLSRYDNKGALNLQPRFDARDVVERKACLLAEWIARAQGRVVLHTGAGVSTAAGVRDFRGARGVWTLDTGRRKVDDNDDDDNNSDSNNVNVGERTDTNNTDRSASDGGDRDASATADVDFESAAPTYAHAAIGALVQCGYVAHVVSQNVDGLHVRSGVPRDRLSELHGNIFMEQCGACGAQYMNDAQVDTVGFRATGNHCRHCANCGGGGGDDDNNCKRAAGRSDDNRRAPRNARRSDSSARATRHLYADGKRWPVRAARTARSLTAHAMNACSGANCECDCGDGDDNRGDAAATMHDMLLDWEDALPADDLDAAIAASRNAALNIAIGTSLQMVPARDLPTYALRCARNRKRPVTDDADADADDRKFVIINESWTARDQQATMVVRAPADLVLALIMQRLMRSGADRANCRVDDALLSPPSPPSPPLCVRRTGYTVGVRWQCAHVLAVCVVGARGRAPCMIECIGGAAQRARSVDDRGNTTNGDARATSIGDDDEHDAPRCTDIVSDRGADEERYADEPCALRHDEVVDTEFDDTHERLPRVAERAAVLVRPCHAALRADNALYMRLAAFGAPGAQRAPGVRVRGARARLSLDAIPRAPRTPDWYLFTARCAGVAHYDTDAVARCAAVPSQCGYDGADAALLFYRGGHVCDADARRQQRRRQRDGRRRLCRRCAVCVQCGERVHTNARRRHARACQARP